MSHSRRLIAFLLAAVVAVTLALLGAFSIHRSAATHAADRTDSAVAVLTAMLDQETGMRGFLYTGQEEFLEPYLVGRTTYEQARVQVDRAAAGDTVSVGLAAAEDGAARRWQAYAQQTIARKRANTASHVQVAQALQGKQQMDQFRAVNAQLRTRLNVRRDALLRRSALWSTAVVVGLAALFGLVGLLAVQRIARRALSLSEAEVEYRVRQREFSDLIQAVDSEAEVHQLVRRHLQRSLPGARATVLIRNNSDNRLRAATELPAGSALAEPLDSAEPRSCLAIRLGRGHQDGMDHDELISCAVCSRVPGTATCEPLLVGGKVIGSVLVEQATPLAEADRRGLADTVAQAAPVLANLKTIAIAESRASTDALTGLANRRSMNDTIKRMAAHAGRSSEPLAAIAFDLDHFKTVNDRYGHEIGDAALSAVGECLRDHLRESDFAARIGGEEFLVLAPATGVDGARVLAEKLREALLREEIPQLLQPITASFGIAVLPQHAGNVEALLRPADRASYLAKEHGRNRVEVASMDELTPAVLPGAQESV